jgi:hypothetical protein
MGERKKYRVILIMPSNKKKPNAKKKTDKKKAENKKVENTTSSELDGVSSSSPIQSQVPSLQTAIFSSLSALPITILKNASKTYILLMNKAVEKYLAIAGVTPDIDGKALDDQITKSAELFSKGMRIVGQASKVVIKDGAVVANEILADKDLKAQIRKMMNSIVDLTKIQMKSIIKVGDEALPLIREKADEVVDIASNTGENIGKSGIRAGLNAAQAIPGAGQVISVVRIIHAITMPAFKLFEKVTDLLIDTLEKVIKTAEKLQPGLTLGLDKAVDTFNAAKGAQILAAKKVMSMSNKIVGTIDKTSNKINTMIANVPQPKPTQSAGRRTRKRTLKKKHRRKSRRRMR